MRKTKTHFWKENEPRSWKTSRKKKQDFFFFFFNKTMKNNEKRFSQSYKKI